MSRASLSVLCFAITALIAALPVVWFFWGLFTVTPIGSAIWLSLPLIAAVTAGFLARYFIFGSAGRLGALRGAWAALITLILCAVLVSAPAAIHGFGATAFYFVGVTLLWCGWFVAGVGALCGWLCERYVLARR